MAILAVVHVLAAIIGVGPTYFFPVLFRASATPAELRGSLVMAQRLARYPQIGGPVAVLSGIALVLALDSHLFTRLWIYGSIALFVVIQAVIMGGAVPATKKVAAWVMNPANAAATSLSAEAEASYRRLRTAHLVASCLGTVLFTLMILKPG